jgi:hypothetical protein
MDKNKINEAVNYAKATNSIEDLSIKKNELLIIKEAIEKNSSDKSFLKSVVEHVEKDKNGKIK